MRNRCAAVAVLGLAAVISGAALAQDSAKEESWRLRQVHATPLSAELPQGAGVFSRKFNNEPGTNNSGHSMWGEQLTLQPWPTGAWHDSIRLDYYVIEASKAGGEPTADSWAYGLSDHTVPDADPQTPWSPPVVMKRQGYRVYETVRDSTVLGKTMVSAEYNVELGTGRSFRLGLYCRKESFKRYAPYYVRIRDSLEMPKHKAN